MADLTIEEIKEKIAGFERMNETELANKWRGELAKKQGGAAPPISGDIILDASLEDFEKAGSKFAMPGLHISVFGMPYWATPGVSLSFPFTISEGADAGKENKISCGVRKEAIFKIKEILNSVGVPYKEVNGRVAFDPGAVAGKSAMVLWKQKRDSRSVDEGGSGNVYCQPDSVHPLGSTLESIGQSPKSLLI